MRAMAPDEPRRADAPVALPDVLQFMRLLWALEHGVQRASKRMSQHLGVTGLQRLVLRIVGLSPGLSAGDIARTLHVHPSTLTGVFSRLTRQRLIVRTRDASDRRRAVVVLTPRGERVNAVTRGTVEAAVRTGLRDVSERDRAISRRVLMALCQALEDDAEVDKPAVQTLSPRRRTMAPQRTRRRAQRPVTTRRRADRTA
jgi:DNA-binding MarR family transcriptional regulator